LMSMHPEVAMHPQGLGLAVAEDMKLHALGHAPSPERFKKAFENAQREVKALTAGTAYTQQGAGALGSAIPTGGAGGGGSTSNGSGRRQGPGVELTALEKQWAKAADMDLQEYAASIAELHPERIVR